MNPNEETIWKKIQQKDIQVFEAYYREHYKTFFLQAYKYLQSPELSQEIVNDVFVRIWEDADKIVIESSLKSYLYRAVINRSLNALKKMKKELQDQKVLASLPREHIEERHMETNELKIRLYKAIDELPEQCKKVFRMSRFENLKQQEIADKLGISIKTVKNHITHALKELGKSMEGLILLLLFLMEIFFYHQ